MKRVFAGACVLGLLAAARLSGAAPLTWQSGPQANGHQYELHFRPSIAWSAAKEAAGALGEGWHLATITSEAEQRWLDATVLVPEGEAGEFWLGGLQVPVDEPDAKAGWAWVTGEAWGYENWGPGEPNDFWSGPGSEQYLAIDGGGMKWLWNDEGRDENVGGFLAERDAASGPGLPATSVPPSGGEKPAENRSESRGEPSPERR